MEEEIILLMVIILYPLNMVEKVKDSNGQVKMLVWHTKITVNVTRFDYI